MEGVYMMSKEDMARLEKKLEFGFRTKKHPERALTRRALANEDPEKERPHQEAYCVLGDAVLKTVLVHKLMEKHDSKEGITEEKKQYESEEGLSEVAEGLEIGSFILTNRGEKKTGADKQPRVQAETLEALIGAMFLDGGYNKTKEAVLKWFDF